jgi:hypothetical protein
MTIKKQLKQHIGKKATRRLYGALPWVGGALALAVGAAVRRKRVRGAVPDMRDVGSSLADTADTKVESIERDLKDEPHPVQQ